MARLALTFAATLSAALLTSTSIYPDTWTQHEQATIDDMESETEATTPADRTRTTIGIGEKVTCSIDPDTWQAIRWEQLAGFLSFIPNSYRVPECG
jgi:hypothetical protein